jgi:hypothetical protein
MQENAVRGHEVDEADAVPRLAHQASDHAELQPVVKQSESGGDASRDPAGKRHDRDLDVVREDLGRERGLLRRRHVVPRVAGLQRRPELLRDDSCCGRRIVDPPESCERRGAEEEHEGHQQRLLPLDDQPPVVGDEEADDRVPPGARVVHRLARPADEDLEPRGLGRSRGTAAQPREVGGRGAVEGSEPLEAVRSEPLGPPSGLAQEQLELAPVGASRCDECV